MGMSRLRRRAASAPTRSSFAKFSLTSPPSSWQTSRIRFGYSIILIASVNYLGLGLAPPAADWGLMTAENQQYISLNVWAVLPGHHVGGNAPPVALNLLADAYVQTAGRLMLPARRRFFSSLSPTPSLSEEELLGANHYHPPNADVRASAIGPLSTSCCARA